MFWGFEHSWHKNIEKLHRNFSSNKNYVFMFYVLIDDDDDDVDVSRTSPISRTCLFRIMYLLFDRCVLI